MKPGSARHATAADTSQAVDALLKSLSHPAKREIEALRALFLEVDPSVQEGVKWNAPSFRTTEYFATTNLRTKAGIGVVLHFGAKARDIGNVRASLDDPSRLLKWVAADRATADFESLGDLEAKKVSFQAILRQWITHL